MRRRTAIGTGRRTPKRDALEIFRELGRRGGEVEIRSIGGRDTLRSGCDPMQAEGSTFDAVAHRALQHRVGGVGSEALGDAEEAQLPQTLLLEECRHQLVRAMIVELGGDTVEVIDVDAVRRESAQRALIRSPNQ